MEEGNATAHAARNKDHVVFAGVGCAAGRIITTKVMVVTERLEVIVTTSAHLNLIKQV